MVYAPYFTMKKYAFFLIFIGLGLFTSCSKIQSITDVVTNPSAREIYARNFEKDNLEYLRWQNDLETALKNTLQLELPNVVSGQFNPKSNSALGYDVELEKGEELFVAIKTSADSSLAFIDIYPFVNDSVLDNSPIVASEWNSKQINYPIVTSGKYKVVIQSGLNNAGSYSCKIYTLPTLAFPVSDKGNESIQSYWGATRDGGKRSHEGLDIFSSRGTPVVAASDGFVSFTGERGLGGKQVWLRNGIFGHSLYYAHLDSISTATRKRVKLGDTLGFVGNTGNAKTTTPHLHFGIYTSGGAIDPLPFIKKQIIPDFEIVEMGTSGITKQRQNQMRLGPKISYEEVATLPSQDTLQIIGKVKDWYHVKSYENEEGFMHQSLIKIL